MATKPSKIVDTPNTPAPAGELDSNTSTDAAAPAAAEAPAAAAPAAAEAPAAAAPVGVAGVGAVKEGNVVKLASGERRVDYIKRHFAAGVSRGQIAKDLGVAYQIVFAATKKPKADTSAAVAAAATAVATPAAAAEASAETPVAA